MSEEENNDKELKSYLEELKIKGFSNYSK